MLSLFFKKKNMSFDRTIRRAQVESLRTISTHFFSQVGDLERQKGAVILGTLFAVEMAPRDGLESRCKRD